MDQYKFVERVEPPDNNLYRMDKGICTMRSSGGKDTEQITRHQEEVLILGQTPENDPDWSSVTRLRCTSSRVQVYSGTEIAVIDEDKSFTLDFSFDDAGSLVVKNPGNRGDAVITIMTALDMDAPRVIKMADWVVKIGRENRVKQITTRKIEGEPRLLTLKYYNNDRAVLLEAKVTVE